jgi:hypothetical protein
MMGEYASYMSVDQCPIKEGDSITLVVSSTGATYPLSPFPWMKI